MNARLLMVVLAFALSVAACGGNDAAEDTSAAAGHDDAAGHAGEEHGAAEGGHVELTADQIKAAALELVPAGPKPIRDVLSLYGVVAPNSERVFEVTARYPGLIRTVTRKTGDAVRKAEVLASIESNESLRTYDLVAPIAGVVTARNANAGEVTGDRTLFTVADLSTVWVEVSLFPRDTAKVKAGQRARISSPDGGIAGEGQVVYVAPFGTSSSQTLVARVLLDNADRRWAPGLYVTAELTLGVQQVPVAIQNEAVQTLEGKSVVFVRTEQGFDAREVRIGRADSEHGEILAGLQPGEIYVTRNSFILKAELGKGEAAHED
jgi:cobalt-zinc-cadmium efflux system membrane fusion protein